MLLFVTVSSSERKFPEHDADENFNFWSYIILIVVVVVSVTSYFLYRKSSNDLDKKKKLQRVEQVKGSIKQAGQVPISKQRSKQTERKDDDEEEDNVEPEIESSKMNEDEKEEEWESEKKEKVLTELYCAVCRKKFKSDQQWKNHEKSKKHKDKMKSLDQ